MSKKEARDSRGSRLSWPLWAKSSRQSELALALLSQISTQASIQSSYRSLTQVLDNLKTVKLAQPAGGSSEGEVGERDKGTLVDAVLGSGRRSG